VANELFDALPVYVFEAGPRGPVEVHVRWDDEKGRFVKRGGVWTIDGAPQEGRFELNPRAYPTMKQLCGLLERGAILVFDYGYPQHELWAPWRTQGTLLCFYRHTAHEDPLIHVGEQDITSHVNLSELASAVEESGMTVHGPVAQSEFLWALGLGQVVEATRGDMNEYFTRRRVLTQLTDAAGLGRIRVLAATRGIGGTPPGFEATG
jgi:SAM-dependent MidA family methyltransferase